MVRRLALCAIVAATLACGASSSVAEASSSPAAAGAASSGFGRVSYSPYLNLPSGCYQGQMHAHTALSDGSGTPEQVLIKYRDLGCAWVALTDHDHVTGGTAAGVVAIPACERTIEPTADGFGHMLLYGIAAVPASSAMRENVSAAAFSSLAHPGWQMPWGKWTVSEALDSRVRAVEVYNPYGGGVWSEPLWDACLSRGAAPFCSVGDDTHSLTGAGDVGAYAMVYADSCTSADILQSLADGSYYCTLGPRLSIAEDGMRFTVSSPDVCDWQFIGAGGSLLDSVAGSSSASYAYTGSESYVRCKAVRVSDGKPAWTNPIFFADWRASVVVNDGSGWTASPEVQLSVDAASDLAPVVDLRVARDAGAWSEWRSYSAKLDYTLPAGDGSSTLRVQFRDELGTVFDAPPVTVMHGVPAPSIALFTPAAGPVGTAVSVTGSGFTDATAVAFHGASAASFTVASATQITATVPSGATSGAITVTTPGGGATSAASFTVVPAPVPKVTLKLSGLRYGAMRLGKSVTATGTVTPTSLAGSEVKLTVQKRGARWVTVKTVARTISPTGAYSWKYKPARRGAYRMRATIAKTAAHTAATTTWRPFNMK